MNDEERSLRERLDLVESRIRSLSEVVSAAVAMIPAALVYYFLKDWLSMVDWIAYLAAVVAWMVSGSYFWCGHLKL